MGTVVGGNYQSIYTGGQIDALLGTVNAGVTPVIGKGINLLDNWYFGNADAIIDQRGGWIVPAGTTNAWIRGTSTLVTVETATKVDQFNTQNDTVYAWFTYNGQDCTTLKSECVRGYTGSTYGIDRWYDVVANISIENDGVVIKPSTTQWAGVIRQAIENPTRFVGETLTFSVLVESITGIGGTLNIQKSSGLNSGMVPIVPAVSVTTPGLYKMTAVIPDDVGSSTYPMLMVGISGAYTSSGSSVKVSAVKLELGSEQTLARNVGTDANPEWVLNDPPPNYQQELAKCQRYYYAGRGGAYLTVTRETGSSLNKAVGFQFPVTMHATPVITILSGNSYSEINHNETPNMVNFYKNGADAATTYSVGSFTASADL